MKKYTLVCFGLLILFPSIAFASWWNPFTWTIFHKTPTPPTQTIQTATTTNSDELKLRNNNQTRLQVPVTKVEDKKTIKNADIALPKIE